LWSLARPAAGPLRTAVRNGFNLALAAPVCCLGPLAASSAAVAQGLASPPHRALPAPRAADRGAGREEPVVFDGAPDRRRYRCVLVVGKIDRPHGLQLATAPARRCPGFRRARAAFVGCSERGSEVALGFVFALGAPAGIMEIARISTNLAKTACGVPVLLQPRLGPVHLANDTIRD
jgi:hypothetical protein